nr:hypothetical protein [Tanacetum cinerariifolium]
MILKKMAPKRARTTRSNPDPTKTTTATEPMTQEAIKNLIAQQSVSNISNYIAENQVKFTSCTLIGSALTWWGEVKKLEVKLWNPKVKGTDITSYTLRLLPEMIQGNVMSYEPKLMQKAIESANEQMDQKLIGIADHQAENKRKFDNTSRNQQNQQ